MTNHQEARFKLKTTQLNKLKFTAKYRAGAILRWNKKNFEDEKLSHELSVTTRQKTKIRNAFPNNMSTYIKLNKVQISFASWLVNLGKKAIKNIPIPIARDNLPGLVSNFTSNAKKKIIIIISGKGAVRVGKGFTLFISNEDMNDIIKIIKSLEDSDVLVEGVTETVKNEKNKNKKAGFLELLFSLLAASLVQQVISLEVKGISGRGVKRAEREYMEKRIYVFF